MQCRANPAFNSRGAFPWTEYLDWIRSPTPLNVYPKIFTKLGRNVKRGAASHSTSWGKRSKLDEEVLPSDHNTDSIYFPEILKRSSSTAIRKLLFKVKPSQRSIIRPIRLGIKSPLQEIKEEKVNNEIEEKVFENLDDEIIKETKRVWLPELDYPIHFYDDDYDIDETHDDVDGVTKMSLLNDDYEDQYAKMWGNVHWNPNHSWKVSLDGRRFATLMLKQKRKHDITKRRLGIIQNTSSLPNHEECHFLDKISQYVCYYLLSKAKTKNKQMQSCENGCFQVGSKREAGSGISGGFSSFVPALNEVAGKKYRKIFVRI